MRNELGTLCPVTFSKPIDQCYEHEGGLYYKVYQDDDVTWEDARIKCQLDGADLASIQDPSDLNFFAAISHPDGSWLGAYFNSNLNHYQYFFFSLFNYNLKCKN